MRILVTTDTVGGVWRYSLALAQSCSQRGVAVTLAVLGPPPDPAQRAEAGGIARLTLVVTGLPLDWTAPDAPALAYSAEALAALATQAGVDSIHLHAAALVGTARWPGPVVVVVHSCLASWWQVMRDGPPPAPFAWQIAATAQGLARADAIIVPSAAFAAQLRAAYGPHPAIQVIHNGRPPLAVEAGPVATRPRAVLATGRFWDDGKDVATLDRVAQLLDAPVLAAGNFRGPTGQQAVAPALRALGTLDEAGMAQALGSARVFVSTARYEPFGLAVLEAAQAGLALVLSDIATFRELWAGAAVLVPVGDAAGFTAAIAGALDDPADAGLAARRRATRFSADAMAEATLGLHRSRLTRTRIA